MIEIVILYVLTKYDATIYKIMKIVDELFFGLLKTSAGTINPALKRLEKIGCVEYIEKMSDGGMLSKTYSITSLGKKHLKDLLLSYKELNPYHIIQSAKILLYCAENLPNQDREEFNNNLLNILELFKIKLEKGLKNEYISLNELQRNINKITLEELNILIKQIV